MDFEKFVIDKLEIIDEKISDLCTRTALTEHKIEDVVTQKVDEKATKFKIITIVFGLVTSIATIFSIYNILTTQ